MTSLAEFTPYYLRSIWREGDQALIDLAAKFDKTELSSVRVSQAEIDAAEQGLSEQLFIKLHFFIRQVNPADCVE